MERIHAERIAQVRTAPEGCGLTQMIVCDPKGVWYLTGRRGTLRACWPSTLPVAGQNLRFFE